MLRIDQLVFCLALCQLLFIYVTADSTDTQIQYMQLMKLKLDSQLESLQMESQSTLISSVAPKSVTGNLTDNGFLISKRSSIQMQFEYKDFLSDPESEKLHAAKIWLFPEVQEGGDEVLDVNFIISISSSTLGVIKRSRAVHTWNNRDPCMALDLTSVLKKLSMHTTEEECNLIIEVTDVKPANSIGNREHITTEEQICLEIGNRNCTKPFVALQYIDIEEYIRPRTGERIDSRRKRDDQESCFAEDYKINLTTLFPMIVLPSDETNIRTCEGNCTSTFSFRQIIFQKLAAVERETEELIDGYPCCVPAETLPLLLLLHMDRKYVLEEVPDTIITSCKCI